MMAMVVEVKLDEKVEKEANKYVKEMKVEVEGVEEVEEMEEVEEVDEVEEVGDVEDVEDCTSASILDVYQQMCAEQSPGYFHVNVAEEF